MTPELLADTFERMVEFVDQLDDEKIDELNIPLDMVDDIHRMVRGLRVYKQSAITDLLQSGELRVAARYACQFMAPRLVNSDHKQQVVEFLVRIGSSPSLD